jgi:hypothetical protein
MIPPTLLFHDAEDVVLADDQVLLVFEGHLGARKLAEEYAVSILDIELLELPCCGPRRFPTAMICPSWGFSLASGMMIPPAVVSSSSMGLTRIRC